MEDFLSFFIWHPFDIVACFVVIFMKVYRRLCEIKCHDGITVWKLQIKSAAQNQASIYCYSRYARDVQCLASDSSWLSVASAIIGICCSDCKLPLVTMVSQVRGSHLVRNCSCKQKVVPLGLPHKVRGRLRVSQFQYHVMKPMLLQSEISRL